MRVPPFKPCAYFWVENISDNIKYTKILNNTLIHSEKKNLLMNSDKRSAVDK